MRDVTTHERLSRAPRRPSPTRERRAAMAGEAASADGRGVRTEGTPAGGSPTAQSPRHRAYLRDVASHPFAPALERDRRLGLSRGHGVRVRRHLIECGLVSPQRISTGRRAGQVLLLSLTSVGAEELLEAGVRAKVLDCREVRRGFYLHRLTEFSARTWPGSTVSDGRSDSARQAVDLVVRIPGDPGTAPARSVAFQLVGDEAAVSLALVNELKRFDEAYLWAESPRAAAALQRLLAAQFPASDTAQIKCLPITSCFPVGAAHQTRRPADRKRRRTRQRRSRTPLVRELIRAYGHLHDLDRLQESPLVELEGVQARTNQLSAMGEAKALRTILVEAATQAASELAAVPTQAHVRHFLERYLGGKGVSEIAVELGVSREWCSRGYRTQAFELAAMQCERLVTAPLRQPGPGKVGGS